MKFHLEIFLTLLIAGSLIYINFKSWHMTRAEISVDPSSWIAISILLISGCILIWSSKRGDNEKSK